MASNTSQTTALTVVAAAWNSNAPPTAGSPGRLRSLFLTGLTWERSTWTPMATSLSVAKDSATFLVCARAMRRSGARRQLLTEAPKSTWVAASVAVESIQQDWMDSCSWRLIAPADRLTIIFTCWPVWCGRELVRPTGFLGEANTTVYHVSLLPD